MDYFNYPYPSPNAPNFNAQPLTRQTITRVNGRDSINALRLAPNSELLALDNTANILWVCVSDGVGMVRAEPFDIVPHKEPAAKSDDFEQRLTALERAVVKMGGMRNESGDSNAEHVENV